MHYTFVYCKVHVRLCVYIQLGFLKSCRQVLEKLYWSFEVHTFHFLWTSKKSMIIHQITLLHLRAVALQAFGELCASFSKECLV